MPSTPLICSSSGASTELSTVSELAPVYEARTMMVGGAMFGYCSIGSDTKPSTPRITTKIEITVESTGRLINLSNFIFSSCLDKLTNQHGMRCFNVLHCRQPFLLNVFFLFCESFLQLAKVALSGTQLLSLLQFILILSLCQRLDFHAVLQT